MPRKKTRPDTSDCSHFKTATGPSETYFVIKSNPGLSFSKSLSELSANYHKSLRFRSLPQESLVFCRFFLSDAQNQKEELVSSQIYSGCRHAAVSLIEQPSLEGNQIILLAYHIHPLIGKNYKLHFSTNGTDSSSPDPEIQTTRILNRIKKDLHRKNLTLRKNGIRTWIYVRNIDTNYPFMVKSRRDFFTREGLTRETRFLASTGIEGKPFSPDSWISIDTLSITNLKPDQIIRMQALSHLNPTHEYGVTFERGIKVVFGDRSHLYLSGTASINNKGEVLFKGNPQAQSKRILANLKALLLPHQASLKDLSYLIVYLRNPNDLSQVKQVFENNLPAIPIIYLDAPVCRPAWLVEAEGEALIKTKSDYPVFL